MPTPASFPNGSPIWAQLLTTDVDRARAFYSDLFGWNWEAPNPEFGGYMNITGGGAMIAGAMHNDGSSGAPDAWSIYLAAEDVDATLEAAKNAGGTLMFGPDTVGDLGTMAGIIDPGGAFVGLWHPGTHAGFGAIGESGAPTWFELHASEFAASVDFYATVFGLDRNVMSDEPDFHYTNLAAQGEDRAGVMDAAGMLPEGTPPHWAIYFQVADTDAVVERTSALGGTVLRAAADTPHGRMAVLADPTGADFMVIQP